jgi:hypothetical protein
MNGSFLRPLLRAAFVLGLLSLPLVAAQAVGAGNDVRIEASAAPKTGLGLFLLVSLQRAG